MDDNLRCANTNYKKRDYSTSEVVFDRTTESKDESETQICQDTLLTNVT